MAKKDEWRNNALVQGKYELSLGEIRCLWFILIENSRKTIKVKEGTKGARKSVSKSKDGKEIVTYYKFTGIERDVQYKIDLDKYAELWEISRNRAYIDVNESLRSLEGRSITLKASDINPSLKKGTAIVPWVAAVVLSDSGTPSIEWNKYMVGYLNDLSRFTKIRIDSLVNLRKFSYIRFYELMKQYEKIGKRYLTIHELQEYIGGSANYSGFGQFKQRKIDPAIKAVNRYTEINVSYSKANYVKEGKKVVGIWFFIEREEKKLEDGKTEETNTLLKENGLEEAIFHDNGQEFK